MRSIVNKIAVKVVVRTFYRQNAGFFLFLFLFFFGVVTPSRQLAYHYTLIRGMLETRLFLALVLLGWFLYGLKAFRFVWAVLSERQSAFLYPLTGLTAGRLFRLWLSVQCLLLLPIWTYSLAVTGVAISRHAYGIALLVQVYMTVLHGAGAVGYRWLLLHPGRGALLGHGPRRALPYWSIIFRQLLKDEKALFGGLKLFGCGILYFLLRDQAAGDHDLRMPFLFYSLSLLGHGALLYRCRQFEETRLVFYRALPVSLIGRWSQYAALLFLLLLPEMLVLGWLTPHPIRIVDTMAFLFSGYSVLLLLYSLLLTAPYTNRDHLWLCLGIFGLLYCGVLGGYLFALSAIFLLAATGLFFRGYARYQEKI